MPRGGCRPTSGGERANVEGDDEGRIENGGEDAGRRSLEVRL